MLMVVLYCLTISAVHCRCSTFLFVRTAGGPGYASSTFTLYTIKTAFTFSNFGLAATMAVAIMLMIVLIYVIQNKIIHGLVLRDHK